MCPPFEGKIANYFGVPCFSCNLVSYFVFDVNLC
jgi:hypothetical protein